jgi:hypothetical protein
MLLDSDAKIAPFTTSVILSLYPFVRNESASAYLSGVLKVLLGQDSLRFQ